MNIAIFLIICCEFHWIQPSQAFSIHDSGWISVSHAPHSHTRAARYVLTDEKNREMLFRGVNINLQQWKVAGDDRPQDPADFVRKCPPNKKIYQNPPLCNIDYGKPGKGKWNQSYAANSQNDLAQIRSIGMDLVRLGISWSLIEPTPGNYSESYINRIAQVISWAKEQDIRVLIDFHQDWYSIALNPSRGGYVDGAPPWAVLNESITTMPVLEQKIWKEIGFDWKTVAAFQTFYTNAIPTGSTMGLQEHYIRMLGHVVQTFKDEVAVLGFEIMNEPPPSVLNPLTFSNEILYPFYRRVIQAVTGVRDGMKECATNATNINNSCAFPDLGIHDIKHLYFVEPLALRNQLDRSIQNVWNFTSYPNIVYAPHTYTNSFTLSKNVPYPQSLDTAWKEAYKMKAPVIVTEFGSGTSPSELDRLGNITQQQDTHMTGSTFWVWKEGNGGWSLWENLYDQNITQYQPRRLEILSRARPYAVTGQLLSLNYNVSMKSLTFTAAAKTNTTQPMMMASAGSSLPPTMIYIPSIVTGCEINVTGGASLGNVTTEPDNSRTVMINVHGTGIYKVSIK